VLIFAVNRKFRPIPDNAPAIGAALLPGAPPNRHFAGELQSKRQA